MQDSWNPRDVSGVLLSEGGLRQAATWGKNTGVFDLDRHHRACHGPADGRREGRSGGGLRRGRRRGRRTGAVRGAVDRPARPASRLRRRARGDGDRAAADLGAPAPAAAADPDVGVRRLGAGPHHRGAARTARPHRLDQPHTGRRRVSRHGRRGPARQPAQGPAAQHRARPRGHPAEQGRGGTARLVGDPPARRADRRWQRRLGGQRRGLRRRPALRAATSSGASSTSR